MVYASSNPEFDKGLGFFCCFFEKMGFCANLGGGGGNPESYPFFVVKTKMKSRI